MSKKRSGQPGADSDAGAESTGASEAAENISEETVKTPEEEIGELNDKYMRALADFENYRKRMRAEKEDYAKYAASRMVEDLLPVLDTFEMALKVRDPGPEVKNFLTGMEMVRKQFFQVLEKQGLESMEAAGAVFDPVCHEAVDYVVDESMEENTVAEVMRGGYRLNGKVIRPAMVRIYRKPGQE